LLFPLLQKHKDQITLEFSSSPVTLPYTAQADRLCGAFFISRVCWCDACKTCYNLL